VQGGREVEHRGFFAKHTVNVAGEVPEVWQGKAKRLRVGIDLRAERLQGLNQRIDRKGMFGGVLR
jgi:hypothetical protein